MAASTTTAKSLEQCTIDALDTIGFAAHEVLAWTNGETDQRFVNDIRQNMRGILEIVEEQLAAKLDR